MGQDGNSPLAISLFEKEIEAKRVFDENKIVLVCDHCAPAPTQVQRYSTK